MNFYLLVYDVPCASVVRHPSTYMWRFGSRVNLSCWIVPESRVPLLPTSDWDAGGVKWSVVAFHERDTEKILALAQASLVAAVEERERALVDGIERLRDLYADVASGDDAALTTVDRKAGAVLRRGRAMLEHAVECAMAFGLTGNVGEVFEGFRRLIKAREDLVYRWSTARRRNMAMQTSLVEVAS